MSKQGTFLEEDDLTPELEALLQTPLPSHWRIARLGNDQVAYIASGGTPDRSVTEYFGGAIRWVKSGELKDTLIYETEERITQLGLENSSAKIFPVGTLLIAMYGATVGMTGILGTEAAINQAICAIVPQHKTFDSRFLQFYFIENRQKLLNARSGGAQPNINQRIIRSLDIILPPLPEQHAIAHVLQTVQNAIQSRRKEIELERERKAALMHHLFTYGTQNELTKESRFGRVPMQWDIRQLDHCAFVQTGIAKGRKLSGDQVITLPYLRVANVQDGYLDLAEIKNIELLKSEADRYKLQPGDVVVTEGGDFDKLGRGFLWHGQIPNCVHQNHIFAVRANRNILLPEYLAYLIQSNYGKAYFLSVAHKTTNLACINSAKLKAFPALISSLDEQKDIATILQACDSKITAIEKELSLHEELFRALLDELMTGRLSALPVVEQ